MKGFPDSLCHKKKKKKGKIYFLAQPAMLLDTHTSGFPSCCYPVCLSESITCLLKTRQTHFAHLTPLRYILLASFVAEIGQPATKRGVQLGLVRFAMF